LPIEKRYKQSTAGQKYYNKKNQSVSDRKQRADLVKEK
jgi:hypothetical protein